MRLADTDQSSETSREKPGVGGNHFVRIRRSTDVRPFVETDGYRPCFEFGEAFQILLIVLVFRPNLRRWRSFPLDKRLSTGADFFPRRQIGSLAATGIEVLTQHVHIVETMRQQVAAPVSRREVV